MRVLHIELGRHLYGGARQVAYLLNGLVAMDKNTNAHLLVCVEDSGVAKALDSNASYIALGFGGDMDMGFVRRLRREISRFRPDWIHIHSRRGETLATLAAILEGIPILYTRRVDNPPAWLDVHCKFRYYTRINCISEGIRKVLRDCGVPEDKLSAVKSAVDHRRYRPDSLLRDAFRQKHGIASSTTVIGVVAQLIPRKGHRLLLEALSAVFMSYPETRVLFFGKGPEEAALQSIIHANGWPDKVKLAGFAEDMEQIYPGLDLVVHPAFMEGLGVSLLEASACGLPIVASSVGGIPEIIDHKKTGLLTKPGDLDSLRSSMLALIADQELRRHYGQNAREKILEEFTVDRMVKGNLELYLAHD